jgi:hypothetical protein
MTRESQIYVGSPESVLPKVDLGKEQGFITDQFLQFYKERGYQLLLSASLLPEDDESVLFTGATITPLKKFLKEGILPPGICMVQKCLRTKRLDEMTDMSKIPDWTHYFTMCGILSAPERLEEVSGEAYELWIKRLGINPDNLLLEASSADSDLSRFWISRGVPAEVDQKPQTYYRWRYGMPGIHGRGINFLLRFNKEDAHYRDLGNVISVEDNNGRVIAYEFGFGLESLISKIYGFKKPMEASLVSSVIPYVEGPQEKIIDVLMAAVVIYHHGIEPGRGKEKHVLKKLVKGLSYLRRKMNLSLDQIEDRAGKFEEVEFGTADSKNRLITGVKVYETQLDKFIDYARNQVHAHQLRNDVGERLKEKIRRQGINMGILPVEIEEILASILQ